MKKSNSIRRKKLSFVIALALLLLSHVIMGVLLITMSRKDLREQIELRMLDIADTAAHQLNGDELEKLTKDDVGSPSYNKAMDTLRSFQNNIHLDFIYAIRDEKDGTFSFMIDPDPESPGKFGDDIESTDALVEASKGTPSADKAAYTDRWGRFYSAYSPVFDSKGSVAAIVGVDFNADWYDNALKSHNAVVITLTMIALTMGVVLWFTLHTFVLEGEKDKYKKKLDETMIREMEHEQELGTAKQLAYTDPLTGVKNKLAYLEAVEKLDKGIADGSIKEFGVIVCDLNGLKSVNDSFGHDEGDNYICSGCNLVCAKFSHSSVYRIGGDEFVVLLEGSDYDNRETLLSELEAQIEVNRQKKLVVVSTGLSVFDPEKDSEYLTVFERADRKMYECKKRLKKKDLES